VFLVTDGALDLDGHESPSLSPRRLTAERDQGYPFRPAGPIPRISKIIVLPQALNPRKNRAQGSPRQQEPPATSPLQYLERNLGYSIFACFLGKFKCILTN